MAREALERVPQIGVDGLASDSWEALEKAVEYGIIPKNELSAAQTQFRESLVMEAFQLVHKTGVDGLSPSQWNAIEYGLKNGLFTRKELGEAQVTYEENK